MKSKRIVVSAILLLLLTVGTISVGVTEKMIVNDATYEFINKEEMLASYFDDSYEISYYEDDINEKIRKEIVELSKKTTYYLLGEPGKREETEEQVEKRRNVFMNLRYAPEVPKDSNDFLGLDTNSQEYKDDILSGISLPGMFEKLKAFEIKYDSYGEIRTTILNENQVFSKVKISNVTMKELDEESNPKDNFVKNDLTIYYTFKKLDGEFKLLHLFAETDDDIQQYMEANEEKAGNLSVDEDHSSNLRAVFDFSKADNISTDTLSKIYEDNKSKLVYLSSIYNMGIVSSANGLFIKEGIIATTYNFIESSLMKAQNIIIKDSLGNVYELEGVVTINVENDIAILKVKEKVEEYVQNVNTEKLEKESAVITLNSKIGVGITTSKGIVISKDGETQTSLPMTEEMQGSPVFNESGQVIGMLNSKSLDNSLSYVTSAKVLKEYSDLFENIEFEDIKSVQFEELKENYYVKYNDENVINSIPNGNAR